MDEIDKEFNKIIDEEFRKTDRNLAIAMWLIIFNLLLMLFLLIYELSKILL